MNTNSRFGATFTFGCLESNHIKYIRRLIVNNGGVYLEYYSYFGVSWDAVFRRPSQRAQAAQQIAAVMNHGLEEEDHTSYRSLYAELEVWPIVYTKINAINAINGEPSVVSFPKHPIRGR